MKKHSRTAAHLPRDGRLAFTVVELITVAAIVGILTALALPVLRGMAKRGSEADCIANLRAWGNGIHLYIGENDGSFPLSWIDVTGGQISWNHFEAPVPTLLREGIGNSGLSNWRRGEQINGCTAHSNEPYGTAGYTYRYYSYLMNWHLGDPGLATYRKQIAAVPRPSRTILLTETVQKKAQTGFYNANYESVIGYLHNAKANALFVDGHIESMTKITLENIVP